MEMTLSALALLAIAASIGFNTLMAKVTEGAIARRRDQAVHQLNSQLRRLADDWEAMNTLRKLFTVDLDSEEIIKEELAEIEYRAQSLLKQLGLNEYRQGKAHFKKGA